MNRTTFTITVLSAGPLSADITLEEVAYAITDGDCSGQIERDDVEITGPQMAAELMAQGSDPAFLGLTDTGQEAQS